MPGRTVLRALTSIGFVHVSTKGSHAKLVHPDGQMVVVPMHGGRDVPRGTLGSILRQAGLSVAEFRTLL
ncbi:MAG: type II toxin-antitoxin system HicA family toxin [Actinomycetota bacterium]|nr:type II toxin-antitoxin system HicA family toxin [Actinomycetota bacterium]